jgi:hypothetical protein
MPRFGEILGLQIQLFTSARERTVDELRWLHGQAGLRMTERCKHVLVICGKVLSKTARTRAVTSRCSSAMVRGGALLRDETDGASLLGTEQCQAAIGAPELLQRLCGAPEPRARPAELVTSTAAAVIDEQ